MDNQQRSQIQDRYVVYEDGRVWSKLKPMFLKVRYETVYPSYVLSLDYKRYCSFPVHTLLANFFIPNPLNKPFVNHLDGNKLNWALSNLEWVTAQENNDHAIAAGLSNQLGETHSQAKLTENQVRSLMSHYYSGMPIKDFVKVAIELKLPIGRSGLNGIHQGRRWLHVTQQYGIKPKVETKHIDILERSTTSRKA